MNENEPSKMSTPVDHVPGITARSLAACLVCLLLAGMYTQYAEVILASGDAMAEQVLPVPAMTILLLLLIIGGVVFAAARIQLLTRAELVCVFFAMLIALPMITQGMWHRLVALIATPPRTGRFEYIDAYSDNLWPHGPNLLAGRLREDAVDFRGAPPDWREIEYELGQTATLPETHNAGSEDLGAISVTLPLNVAGRVDIVPGDPHLLSVLARTRDTGPESYVFCRVYEDDSANYTEVLQARKADTVTYIHQKGFMRLGVYGLSFSERCRSSLRIEFGLSGRGKVQWADPKLFSVAALENTYKGRKVISESEWNALPPEARRSDLVVRPDRLLSLSGLWFLLQGYIPVRDWIRPVATWGAFMALLIAAVYATNIIMRRQWADGERFGFPNARIPMALMGLDDEAQGPFASVWRNRYAWAGFAFAVIWGGLKGWHFYNSSVPDTSVQVALAPYFQDPGWGAMWHTSFSVSVFIVSIAIFFELNVLLSMVVGYWIYRSLFWTGEWTDWKVLSGYPWRYEQTIGSYVGYFAAVVFFSRGYLKQVFRSAVRGDAGDPQDVLSPRGALVLLAGSFVGAALWAVWLGTGVMGIVAFFFFLALVGFVASRFRAECGLPYAYFTPYDAMISVVALGGITMFGASSVLTALLASGFITVSVFFFVPGAQLELIQVGRRLRVRPRHITYALLLGLFGGIVIGGWVLLSNAYAQGADTIRYQWAFDSKDWFFGGFKRDLANATTVLQNPGQTAPAGGTHLGTVTIAICAGVTFLLTMLRQFFSGFWFHPIGFVLSSTYMMDGVWGSLLVAWVIRSIVLRFGGATFVRYKLQPFFVGAFVGATLTMVLFHAIGAHALAGGATSMYGAMP
jgi:hypothetical protein